MHSPAMLLLSLICLVVLGPDITAIEDRMRHIRHKILVLSGKGGVGKSTFAAQLAFALAAGGSQASTKSLLNSNPFSCRQALELLCSVHSNHVSHVSLWG